MDISALVLPESVIANLRVTSKKQALQELATKAAELTGQPERALFAVLMERERLATTALRHGIAHPTGQHPDVDRLTVQYPRHATPHDLHTPPPPPLTTR